MTNYLANIMENSLNKTHLVSIGWCWPKDIPYRLGFHTGYDFRSHSSPHLCWMVVAMRSWIESLTALSYFGFARVHFGSD